MKLIDKLWIFFGINALGSAVVDINEWSLILNGALFHICFLFSLCMSND